ncbi:MAG: hypothetical protein MUF49_30175 [Oculatellaceae cyanobacterium Prado106]|jgi:hypothetical protein|nr:hypothetical protein [Oculatellaceae cyanobacterium Prado106]
MTQSPPKLGDLGGGSPGVLADSSAIGLIIGKLTDLWGKYGKTIVSRSPIRSPTLFPRSPIMLELLTLEVAKTIAKIALDKFVEGGAGELGRKLTEATTDKVMQLSCSYPAFCNSAKYQRLVPSSR